MMYYITMLWWKLSWPLVSRYLWTRTTNGVKEYGVKVWFLKRHFAKSGKIHHPQGYLGRMYPEYQAPPRSMGVAKEVSLWHSIFSFGLHFSVSQQHFVATPWRQTEGSIQADHTFLSDTPLHSEYANITEISCSSRLQHKLECLCTTAHWCAKKAAAAQVLGGWVATAEVQQITTCCSMEGDFHNYTWVCVGCHLNYRDLILCVPKICRLPKI